MKMPLKTKMLFLLLIIAWLPIANAWLAPVNFSEDNDGVGVDKHTVTATNSGVNYDRCDTPLINYTFPEVNPTKCHRWNLVWESIVDEQVEWEPEVGGAGYRLPTIKELVRLFDYTGGAGLTANPIISNWLTVTADKKEWLISSSYRDIDGDYDQHNAQTGRLQIFAINIATGEVKTFEPGKKSPSLNELQLCESLYSNGDCDLDSTHSIYAIRVMTGRLSEL